MAISLRNISQDCNILPVIPNGVRNLQACQVDRDLRFLSTFGMTGRALHLLGTLFVIQDWLQTTSYQ